MNDAEMLRFFTDDLKKAEKELMEAQKKRVNALRRLNVVKSGASSGEIDELFFKANPKYASNRFRKQFGI